MKFYYQSKFLIIPTKILMDQEKLNFWSSWTTFWQSAEYWHVTLVPNNLSKWLFKKILRGKRFYHDSPCSKWLSSVLVQCSYPSTILFPWSIMMFQRGWWKELEGGERRCDGGSRKGGVGGELGGQGVFTMQAVCPTTLTFRTLAWIN